MRFPSNLWQTFDPTQFIDGTPWYGPYGAEQHIKYAFILTIGYGVIFALLLCGCCDCRPRRKRVDPVEERRRDSDVKNERDRVADKLMERRDQDGSSGNPLSTWSNDLVIVRDLVKKYFKKDPNPRLDETQDTLDANLGRGRSSGS